MVAISLKLPEKLARESKAVAAKLGISRTELIRTALVHELARIQARLEREAMAKSFRAMQRDADYLAEEEAIDAALDTRLPREKDRWWE